MLISNRISYLGHLFFLSKDIAHFYVVPSTRFFRLPEGNTLLHCTTIVFLLSFFFYPQMFLLIKLCLSASIFTSFLAITHTYMSVVIKKSQDEDISPKESLHNSINNLSQKFI